jgi:hypothetical protein
MFDEEMFQQALSRPRLFHSILAASSIPVKAS